jgi:hypothetical protein
MADGITNFGGTFAISTTAEDTDLTTEAAFELLTYTNVPNVGSLGDTGITQNVVSYSTWDRNVASKGKGEADAGSPTVEFLDVDSAGMTAMLAAAAVDNAASYAFEIVWPDGTIEFNRGIVTGPQRMKGGNEDFKRLTFTLGFSQTPILGTTP